VIAILHTASVVSVTAVLGLTLRCLAPHLKDALRELTILLVIVMTSRKKLSARTGQTLVRELTRHEHRSPENFRYADSEPEMLAALALDKALDGPARQGALSRTEPSPTATRARSA
jgi:hypothetical protein